MCNITFLSDVAEQVVNKCLEVLKGENDLHQCYQSAYICYHSTALTRNHNDIQAARDVKVAVLFITIGLSAVFDTVDHHIM